MAEDDYLPKQRLLRSDCLFTCIYFPGILMLLKFNDGLYYVGTYKFIPILAILMFAEVIKLAFSLLQIDEPTLSKIDTRSSSRVKKSLGKRLREIIKFFITLFITTLGYYVVVILFGCPLLTHHEETIMLTVTLTSLTLIPACLHLGVDESLLLLTGASAQTTDLLTEAVKRNVKATLLGTWIGTVVIPLDWNQPWQTWPVPCITGALLGYMVAHFITLVKVWSVWKRRENDSNKLF